MKIRVTLCLRVHSFTASRFIVAIVCVVGLTICACRPPVPAAAKPESGESSAQPLVQASAGSLLDEEVSELKMRAQGVGVLLPGAAHFGPEQRAGAWSTRKHDRTGVTLAVLHKLARRTVTPEECEEAATRSLRALREPASGSSERRTFRTNEYYGQSESRVTLDGSSKLVLHAAGLSRCLSIVIVDPAPFAQSTLDVMRDSFLPTVRALGVEERAQEQRPSVVGQSR